MNQSKEDEAATEGTSERLNFFAELKRRHVFGATAAYLISAWVLVEVAELVFDAFDAPAIWLQILIISVIALAPVAMILAWFFDITWGGIVNTDDEDRRSIVADIEKHSATTSTQYMLSDRAAEAAIEEDEPPYRPLTTDHALH